MEKTKQKEEEESMSNIKLQPHSAEAEKALLGSILIGGNDVFEEAKHWVRKSDAFYSEDNRKLWIAMHRLFRDREGIDTVTVIDNFKRLNPDYDKKGEI